MMPLSLAKNTVVSSRLWYGPSTKSWYVESDRVPMLLTTILLGSYGPLRSGSRLKMTNPFLAFRVMSVVGLVLPETVVVVTTRVSPDPDTVTR